MQRFSLKKNGKKESGTPTPELDVLADLVKKHHAIESKKPKPKLNEWVYFKNRLPLSNGEVILVYSDILGGYYHLNASQSVLQHWLLDTEISKRKSQFIKWMRIDEKYEED